MAEESILVTLGEEALPLKMENYSAIQARVEADLDLFRARKEAWMESREGLRPLPGPVMTAVREAVATLVTSGDPHAAAAWLSAGKGTLDAAGGTIRASDLLVSLRATHSDASAAAHFYELRGADALQKASGSGGECYPFLLTTRSSIQPFGLVFVIGGMRGSGRTHLALSRAPDFPLLSAEDLQKARHNTAALVARAKAHPDCSMTLAHMAFHCHGKGLWASYLPPAYQRSAVSKETRTLQPPPYMLLPRPRPPASTPPFADVLLAAKVLFFMSAADTMADFVEEAVEWHGGEGVSAVEAVKVYTAYLWREGVRARVAETLARREEPEIEPAAEGQSVNLANLLGHYMGWHKWRFDNTCATAVEGRQPLCPITLDDDPTAPRVICFACESTMRLDAMKEWLAAVAEADKPLTVCPVCHAGDIDNYRPPAAH